MTLGWGTQPVSPEHPSVDQMHFGPKERAVWRGIENSPRDHSPPLPLPAKKKKKRHLEFSNLCLSPYLDKGSLL